ncbi:MAG: response regulator transcription factor [Dehalococcoidia bacterium]
MRSVAIISTQPGTEALVTALEGAGLEVTVLAPRDVRADDQLLAGAYVVDCRDVSRSGLKALVEHGDEHGIAIIALVTLEMLNHVSLELPIDDFAVVPGDVAEVTRRVERVLWRRYGVDAENMVVCGPLSIDLSNYRVAVDGEGIILTFKEYELLRFLAMNPGQVFTREQLLNRVWGYDYFGGARTVDVHIRRIRSKIEVRGRVFIETVRNVGYRMIASGR